MFYNKFDFYIVKYIIHFVPKKPTYYFLRCIYIVRNVPVIFSSTSCISNINRYQQKISLGIGQMSILLWAKNISGNKLLYEQKLTKNSKRKSNFLQTFIWQKFRFCKRRPAFTFPELTTQQKTQIRKNLQCNLKFGNLILPPL